MVTHQKFRLGIFFMLLCVFSMAQVLNPVKWNSHTKKINDDTFELVMEATLDEGWHIFSSYHQDGGIGIPTALTWKENKDFELQNKLKEIGKLHDEYNEMFEEQQKFFGDKVAFVQTVKATTATTAEVELMFQVCDDEKCLAPDYKTFTFELNPSKKEKAKEEKAKEEKAKEENVKNEKQKEVEEKKEEKKAESAAIKEQEEEKKAESAAAILDSTALSAEKPIATEKLEKGEPTEEKDLPREKNKRSFWEFFIGGLFGGFAALLMPCIFPMIPLTVSMFTKQSKSRSSGIVKAVVYGLSIIGIYVLLGLLVTAAFGADALNVFATNPWVNIAFFLLFVVFAISFFGAFEITLPSKWVNSADKGADKGGMIGIFFMAFTLVLVSFSCTGPIIGTVLVESAKTGALLGPAIAMFGFSLALALPFTLFAIFPSWLNSLPRSGGWLNTVKVSLGFIELAFALKFLSNADLVWQAHWLERELFIAIWIAIFLSMGLYLFNAFRTSHDSPTERIGTPRLLFGIAAFVCVVYLLPGMWGAPLKLVSGLTPPKNYSESPFGLNEGNSGLEIQLPEHAHFGPHKIPSFHDLDKAFAYAKTVNKPVMIDFTGDACANCRKVEDNVWSDPKVKEKLSNEVVLASLYVDRRVELPQEEQKYSETKGRVLKTIGDKWQAFQIEEFESNSQPLYIIVDENLERYNTPLGAEMDVEDYLKWMDKGIKKFKQKK